MAQASPMVCPVLAGREAELAALLRLLDSALAGRNALALVSGEAGAGKSRLVREVARRAAERGALVVAGYCTERDRDYPFAPLIDALRQYLRDTGQPPAALFGPHLPLIADLLPEVAAPARDAAILPPEQEKRRRFEGIASLLAWLAERQPLLLVLEDLHWADDTSLELIDLLHRRLAGARMLVLATARTDEPDAPLGRRLAALRRARALHEVPLGPLSRDDVTRMLAAMLPAPPLPALAGAVYERTDGNPFFVEELLATVPPGAGVEWLLDAPAVPATVGEAVLQRMAGLPDDARALAELAAVIGRYPAYDLLRTAAGLDPDRFLSVLAPLLDRQVLVEERRGGQRDLAFRHALTRDAIHDRLLTPHRRALHRRVAEAVEVRAAAGDPVVAADLGYHFHAAGVWDQALIWAGRAGDAARAVQATAEALQHDQRALDAALALDDPFTAMLHVRCGHGLALLGAFERARASLESALTRARAHADVVAEQAALDELAGLYASRDYRRAQAYAEQALLLARGLDRRREGRALNRLGNVLTNLMRFAEGRALHEDALAIFEALDDRWGSADCLDLIGMARYLAGEIPEARDAFGRAAAIFETADDRERLASALTSRGLALAVLDGLCATDASPAECRADAERGLRLSREISWRAGEAYALVSAACVELMEGRHGAARRQLEAALAIAEEIDHQQWTVIARLALGVLHADLLDDAAALAQFERALAVADAIGAAQWSERLRAWIARCRMRLDEAWKDLATGGGAPASIGGRRALVTAAEAALARGDGAGALAAAERLLAGAAGPRAAAAVLLRARALAALGRTGEAAATLLEARRLAREHGPRTLLWQIAAARADLRQGGDPAAAAAATARAEILALAETIDDAALSATLLGAAPARRWLPPERRRRTGAHAAPGGLSPREREVVAHVARGLSNKEIGSVLVLSERTVETHIGSCFAKLGLTSRSQLAAWAVAQGITER